MLDIAVIVSLLGLFAAISWGTADFFAAKSSKALSPEIATLVVGAIGAVAFSLFYLFRQGSEPWVLEGVLFAAGAGIFMGAGLLAFYRGLDVGPVSIVSPVGSAYPLVTTIIALSVFGDKLSSSQLFGIVLIVVGIMSASGLFSARKSERRLTKGIMYGIFTFVLWGIAFVLLGEAVSQIGWEKTTFVDIWFELVAIVIFVSRLKSRQKFSFNRAGLKIIANKYLLAAALTQVVGLVVFNIGLTLSASSAIITAISATYPALTIFLALKHFNEKVTLVPMLGAAVTIIGVVILSF
jgi:drug/metabolite transporter (DMT)-like permease